MGSRSNVKTLAPRQGYFFNRPLVLLHSDDWGRVGVRDRQGFEELRAAGVPLGEHPYDFYTLETRDDVNALREVLQRHRDSAGRPACMVMNFVVANLDFAVMEASGFGAIHLRSLTEGLPGAWQRPGLFDAYRQGIAEGVFYPGLHGLTHFCRAAVEHTLADDAAKAAFLQTFWKAQTPYIYRRMPWVGFEYWNPESEERLRFLSAGEQRQLTHTAAAAFSEFFGREPRSASAPGYQANAVTHAAWARCGVRTAQNGPGLDLPPHFDRHGILHLYRNLQLEPAVDPARSSVEDCLSRADLFFARGLPAVVSIHSINFQSSLVDFRGPTLRKLDRLLGAFRAKYADLLYVHDADLHEIVNRGCFESTSGALTVTASKRPVER